jgi:hypothetical protein
MERVKLLPVCLAFIVAAAPPSPRAQSSSDKLDKHPWGIRGTASPPYAVPFSIDRTRSDFPHTLQVLGEDEMTPRDRDLAADAESSIQERAGFESLEFNEGQWTYAQIVCPALPNHLLLRFTRNDGTRAMSMFSAAIPRNGEGRVRIIPIVRMGYSLFSPAPIGALTIDAFNHIRAEENSDQAQDWLTIGMCYAALAGANPKTETLKLNEDDGQSLPLTAPPTLLVKPDGTTAVSFDDISATPRPRRWTMFFDRKGKLLKATHAAIDRIRHQRIVGEVEINESTTPPKQP